MSGYITVREFVSLLTGEDADFVSGRKRGYLEALDEIRAEERLDRMTMARITHQYMRMVLGIPDEEDISPANVLRDLYDCHTCVNHIAQVYLKGLLEPRIDTASGAMYFGNKERARRSEAESVVRCIFDSVWS